MTARRLATGIAAGLDRWLSRLLALILAALLALVFAATVLRYLAGSGFAATEELGIWMHTALVFLGLPLIARGPLAMRIDILTTRLGRRGQAGADVVSEAVILAALLVLAGGAGKVMALIGGTSPALGLPEAWRFLPVLVGAGLGVARLIVGALADGRSLRSTLAIVILGLGLFGLAQLPPVAHLDMPSLVACLVAVLALAAGAPFVHALIVALALAIPFGARLPEAAIVQQTVAGMGKFLLLAVPFFLLAGLMMTAGGLAHRLVRLASALVGHRRGGIAEATLVTNLMFAGVSGSSIADAAFGAKVLAPALVADGMRPDKAAAVVAATAVLPNIVPPSVALLLLASATDLSVGALFSGGLVAGLVLAAAMALMLHFIAASVPRPPASGRDRLAALVGALPALGLGAVVFLGIRLGIATPTEAAALAAVYALVAALAAPGGRRATLSALVAAGREAAAVGLMVAASAPLTFLIAVDGVPEALAGLVTAFGSSPVAVMLAANLILLAVGGPLDVGPGILLFAPLLLPVAVAAGIDPTAFGVILTVNLMIGALTPPVGVLVFVAAGITRQPVGAVFRAVLPLTLALVAAMLLMALAVALGLVV